MVLIKEINKLEVSLSKFSGIPVIGTVAGCGKVVMGVTQMISGLACSIITAIPAPFTGNWSYLNSSCTHIKHGMGNIFVGFLEATPVVQQVLFVMRMLQSMTHMDAEVAVYTGHQNKFMPYASLVEQDWEIGGCVPETTDKVKEIYKQKLHEKGNAKNIPVKQKMMLAQDAINQYYDNLPSK